MNHILKSTSSNSHHSQSMGKTNTEKKAVTFNLSLDKLNLVFDPKPQGGGDQPTKEDLINFFTSVYCNISTYSDLGIFRPRSKGGYAVSIAGKVPLSESPLIWSQPAGYLLQIGCKTEGAAFYRLDINPAALNPIGIAHLRALFDYQFHIGWSTLTTARVTRCDAALDIDGVALNDWVWDLPQRRSRTIHSKAEKFETIYIGGKTGSPMVVYDKARQLKLPPEQERTRVEFRQCKGLSSLGELAKMPCPFEKLRILNPMELPQTHLPFKRAVLIVGNTQGIRGITSLLPASVKENAVLALHGTKPDWWKPADAWNMWPETLSKALPGLLGA